MPRSMAALEAAEGLTGPLPEPPPQGSLLPETYFFEYGDTRATVLARMQKAMADILAELWPERADDLPFEAPRARRSRWPRSSRRRPASQRSARRSPRCSSTACAAACRCSPIRPSSTRSPAARGSSAASLPGATSRSTSAQHLPHRRPAAEADRQSGPRAIAAVLNPAETDFLYFVADGTGGHAFAADAGRAQPQCRPLARRAARPVGDDGRLTPFGLGAESGCGQVSYALIDQQLSRRGPPSRDRASSGDRPGGSISAMGEPMTASSAARAVRRRGLMLVVSSPSGAGKTTITRALLESEPNSSSRSR